MFEDIGFPSGRDGGLQGVELGRDLIYRRCDRVTCTLGTDTGEEVKCGQAR